MATIEDAAKITIQIMEQLPQDAGRAQYIFTGISQAGYFATITIRSDRRAVSLVPSDSPLKVAVLHDVSRGNLAENIEKRCKNSVLTDGDIYAGMRETLLGVAKTDPTVNDEIFFDIIK